MTHLPLRDSASDDRYPILVVDFDKDHPADLAVCERCHAEMTWNPEDGDPYDLCIKHTVPTTIGATGGCGGQIVFKFMPGVRCGGCGEMAFSMPLSDAEDDYCSRVCQLQAEYARNLKEKAA